MPIPDLDSLMVLEAPFARSPYEDLRRRLRTHQRITDRDFASINTLVSDLAIKGGQDGRQEMLEKVETIIERVRGMKEKVRGQTCRRA
jgi:macrophage erythroblast attacher